MNKEQIKAVTAALIEEYDEDYSALYAALCNNAIGYTYEAEDMRRVQQQLEHVIAEELMEDEGWLKTEKASENATPGLSEIWGEEGVSLFIMKTSVVYHGIEFLSRRNSMDFDRITEVE